MGEEEPTTEKVIDANEVYAKRVAELGLARTVVVYRDEATKQPAMAADEEAHGYN